MLNSTELFIIEGCIFDSKRLHELGVIFSLSIMESILRTDGVNASLIHAEQLLKKIDETTELKMWQFVFFLCITLTEH